MRMIAVLVLGLAALLQAQDPAFTTQPTLTKNSATNWTIAFAVDRATQVEVSIVNIVDSTVVRHLAGGLLGSGAPAPLQKDALSQTLTWDGKNDLGQAVTVVDSELRARVRAGLSVSLVKLFGDNPTLFQSGGSQDGIVVAPDGYVYVCGQPGRIHQEHYIKDYKIVRKFDRNGRYVMTVFPPPANLSLVQVQGWGARGWPDGSFSITNGITSIPGFSSTIFNPLRHPAGHNLFMMDKDQNLCFGGPSAFIKFKTDGSIENGTASALAKSPATPYLMGMAHITPLRGGTKVLFSGMFHAIQSSGHLLSAPDTSFYRDGRVFVVDIATGAATVFVAFDSVPKLPAERLPRLGGGEFYASIHGTAQDSSGRIYICDRLHQRIAVYDSAANLLGSIPRGQGEKVAVSKRTGAIFVLTRTQASTGSTVGGLKLIKYASFANGMAPVCSVAHANTVYNRLSMGHMALNETATETRIWVSGQMVGLKVYQDDGASLSMVRDFYTEGLGVEQTFDRLAVDRRNETIYINNGRNNIYKITDWANPRAVICSTAARKPLSGGDMTVALNGYLYVREGTSYVGPLTRYTTDWYHAPANWPNTGKNIAAFSIYNRDGSVIGDRGMAAALDGRVAIMYSGFLGRNTYHVSVYPDSGCRDTNYGRIQIAPLPGACGGVRYDLQGNLYVGAVVRTTDHKVPASFVGDLGYNTAVGSVVRYNGTDSGSISASAAPGSSVIYSAAGLSPFSADPGGGGCLCHSPRFDLDFYGRLFVPDGITNRVTVLDNAGNVLIQFGGYGNSDSRGGLAGPGSTIASPSIPLLFATSAMATEDYIYVSDFANCRIARVKMNYALDNVPGLTENMKADERKLAWRSPLFGLSSWPVPFHGRSTFAFSLPSASGARLEVYDVRGGHIRTLAQGDYGSGAHRVQWDGRDAKGRAVAAGLYVCRLTAGAHAITNRTILAR